MSQVSEHASVKRVKDYLAQNNLEVEIKHLTDTARTAVDAAAALGVEVGQIASSIVFSIPEPILIITSGKHRVDTSFVEQITGIPKLGRADADFVRTWSGFAIGGVSPVGWLNENEIFQPKTFIDNALAEYEEIWAAAGHTHVVFKTNFSDLMKISKAKQIEVEK